MNWYTTNEHECPKKLKRKIGGITTKMTNKLPVFTEIFPVRREALPILTLYQPKVSGSVLLDEIGRKVCYRLQTEFGGHWKWDKENQYVITDSLKTNLLYSKFFRKYGNH